MLVGDRGETGAARVLGFADVQGWCYLRVNSELYRFTHQQDDITLVIDNAIKYNKYDTQFYKVATRLRAMSKVVLPQLNNVIVPCHLQGPAPSFQVDQEEVDPSAQYAEASDRLGDLEPPLRNIELLFLNEAIREHEDLEFLLGDQNPISALLAYEFGVSKQTEPSPPPSPSPPPPLSPPSLEAKKGKKGKGKKGVKNYGVPMDVEQLAVLDGAPGFRARVPRPRGDETEEDAARTSTVPISAEMGSEDLGAGPSTEPKGKKGKVKTAPAPTPIPIPGADLSGLDHEPHQIETIDKQQSFKMFNEGWILPPDQKRGGRVRVERPPPPPPKKKKSCAYCTLLARVLLIHSSAVGQPSTPMSPPHEPVELPIPPSIEPTEDIMDVDVEPRPPTPIQQSPTHHGAVSDTGLPVQSIQESVDSRGNRIVIIEELDTPATRRERTRRVKAERARLAVEVAAHTMNAPESPGSGQHDHVAGPAPTSPTPHIGQDESDLSSLSGDSDEASEGGGVRIAVSTGHGRGRGRGRGRWRGRGRGRGGSQTRGGTVHPWSPGLGSISLPPGERLESGTLGILLKHYAFMAVSDGDPQFGRNTSHTPGGAPSCTMTICRRFRRASYYVLMARETIS